VSSNISIGASNLAGSFTSLEASSYKKTESVRVSPAPQITTTKQLANAELQGQSISIGDEQLVKVIDRAIKALQGPNTTSEVSFHKKTNQIMVKILDKDSGEVIREIPPEKTLDMVAKLMEIAGILIDEKV